MQLAKYSFVLCVAAICFTQGETRRICGLEVEYRGYDPLEALRFVQEQQIQEFVKYQQLLQQLKFKLKSDDYLAWQRCLSEYDSAKLAFTKNCARIKLSFQTQLKSLSARNLAAEQYQQELQNLLQQFQTQFTPSVESFHTNIKNLFDTIQDEKRRKQWWSTVKTTQITTGADGTQTRTSLTQSSSGIGDQQTGYSRQSESNSVSGSLLGGPSGVVSKTSSFSKTKIGTVVGGSGGYGSQSQYSSNSQKDMNEDNSGSDYSSGGGSGGFQKTESKYRSSIESKTSGVGSDYNNNNGGDFQQSQSKYQSTQVSGGYGASQESKYGSNQESKSSDYGGASQVTKESKYSASSVSSGQTGGSSVDNSQINFSSVQSRTGLKGGYGTDSYSKSEAVVKNSGYGSSGGYRRRRRTLGLLAGALGANKRSALGGGSYGSSGYGANGVGGGLGVGVSVGVGAGLGGGSGGPGGYPQGGFEGGSSKYQAGSSFQSESGFQGSSGGFQGSSGGFQGSSGGFQGSSGGFQGKSGLFQGSSGGFQGSSGGFQSSGSQGGSLQGSEYSSRSSLQGSGFQGGSFQGSEYNSGNSLSGDYENSMQGSKYSKTVKKEKFQETQMSMGSSGVGSSNYGGY